jgi:outer membrane biosynthesis protein TonB
VRTTLTISVIAHALLGGLVALSGPQPLAKQAENPIVVEIVSPDEVGETPQAQGSVKANTPEASTVESPEPLPSPSPQPRDQPQKDGKTPRSDAAPAPSGSTPRAAQAESKPDQPQPQSQPEPQPQTQPWSSWVDSALSSPLVIASAGLDAAVNAANLSPSDVAAFKARLQECWNPPAGLADTQHLVVVLRVSLKPNGALTAEPTLLAASASPEGATLMQTAMRALRQCQPYGFLPPAKYKEWKVLDLSFSPGGLSALPVF